MSEENMNREPEEEPVSENTPASEEDATTEETVIEKTETEEEESESEELSQRKQRSISLSTFFCIAICLVTATALITATFCLFQYRKYRARIDEFLQTPTLPETEQNQPSEEEQEPTDEDDLGYPFELIGEIFGQLGLKDVDQDAMIEAALKEYVYATGDRYAAYYNAEESAELFASNTGSSQGIGINVIEDTVAVENRIYKVFRVINVMEGSPALAAGMRLGDMIYEVGIGENAEEIEDYDLSLKKLQGAAGTKAEFSVYRETEEGIVCVEFRIDRGYVTTTSVRGKAVLSEGQKIGVVKIFRFDATTPTQFKAEMNRLIGEGCTAFVYDVRNNPGGLLDSIEAVLSYFLNEGDTIIITKDAAGNQTVSQVKVVNSGTYESCMVTQEEIGMYRQYPSVVLCNQSTASAAELFTAAFRDYGLAPVVGMTTYGKGTMQQFVRLSYYGYQGTLRLTTHEYYPPSGVGYDGEGISPDEGLEIEPSEELRNMHLFEIDPERDNQLAAALSSLVGKLQ